jgi:hypothetical protein
MIVMTIHYHDGMVEFDVSDEYDSLSKLDKTILLQEVLDNTDAELKNVMEHEKFEE